MARVAVCTVLLLVSLVRIQGKKCDVCVCLLDRLICSLAFPKLEYIQATYITIIDFRFNVSSEQVQSFVEHFINLKELFFRTNCPSISITNIIVQCRHPNPKQKSTKPTTFSTRKLPKINIRIPTTILTDTTNELVTELVDPTNSPTLQTLSPSPTSPLRIIIPTTIVFGLVFIFVITVTCFACRRCRRQPPKQTSPRLRHKYGDRDDDDVLTLFQCVPMMVENLSPQLFSTKDD